MIGETDHYPQGGLLTRPAGSTNGKIHRGIPETFVSSEPTAELSEASEPIVVLDGASKRLKDIYVLRNVSITVNRGDVFGLLGPTGAGKSTLLKLILGFLRPDEGTVSVFGAEESSELAETHGRIGYLPEHPHFHPNFSGWEYLRFQARLSGLTRRNARASAERVVETVAAQAWIKRRMIYYTPEMLHRLALAVALVGSGLNYPEFLILDEPSSHLDRGAQSAVRDILLECRRQGSTILMASHRVTEVERICDTVGIIKAGRLVLQQAVENNARTIIVAVPREDISDRLPALLKGLQRLHPFVSISGGQGSGPLVTSLPSGDEILNAQAIKGSALRMLVEAGWDVISVYLERKDLESIYARTLSPVAQIQTGIMSTGPLGTGPLGMPEQPEQADMGAMTGPLDSRFTKPLTASEGGQKANGRETSY